VPKNFHVVVEKSAKIVPLRKVLFSPIEPSAMIASALVGGPCWSVIEEKLAVGEAPVEADDGDSEGYSGVADDGDAELDVGGDGVGVALEPSLNEVDTTPDTDSVLEELGLSLSDPVVVS
jgi:hypothetical protein